LSPTSLHARVNVKTFGSSRSAASYASKYLSKDLGESSHEFNGQRYHVGNGVESPIPAYSMVLAGDVFQAAADVLASYRTPQFRQVVVSGAGPPAIWAGW
jgi:hypothetical protein